MLAGKVNAETADTIPEAQLMACINERTHIEPADYDLAMIERALLDVRLERAGASGSLHKQVWAICQKFMTTLDKCGYQEIVKKQSKLALHHMMKRVAHIGLQKRMMLTYKLRKTEFDKNVSLFVRELAKEAKAFDRHGSASRYSGAFDDSGEERGMLVGTSTGGGSKRRSDRRNKGGGKSNDSKARGSTNKNRGGAGTRERKRDREFPPCLNRKCGKRYFINDCPTMTPDEARELKLEYHEVKRQKKEAGTITGTNSKDAKVGNINDEQSYDNTSLFSASFCSVAIDTAVMADIGSNFTVMPGPLLSKLQPLALR